MKKIVISVACTILVLALMAQLGWLEVVGIHRFNFGPTIKEEEPTSSTMDSYNFYTDADTGIHYRFKTEGDYFYIYQNGKWDKMFLKGVNIGAGEPGLFPGDLSIEYETYYRWFGYISEMNCNCIRVYTTMRPQFYTALFDFNEQSDNPIYLFQGVWMDEDDITALADVYAQNEKIASEFKTDALNMVDAIHGNITLPERAGFASGAYVTDVSKYFLGWILGMEFDPYFIMNTNNTNPDKNSYDGQYLYTQSATPFEAFLCSVGDAVIKRETENYQFQAPVAFTNWITTDPLTHPDEPHEDEDLVTLNIESIKGRSAYKSNLFASYHIYPYYPDSMNYQQDYLNNLDENGKIDTYSAYLADLKLAHTMPIIVAEFGIPTSRGMGHESVMGYNQGNVDETQQGEMLVAMFESIYSERYAGGLLFAWQDEWFKRTWNNVKFDTPDTRPFWSNVQTCEQAFGILTFDPGETSSVCYVDGDGGEWAMDTPIASTSAGELYMKCDEESVYFMIRTLEGYDFENDTILLPIDTIAEQGNDKMNGIGAAFDKGADFVIRIQGQDNSRIVVDQYYDVFYYLYGEQYKMISLNDTVRTKNTGNFNNMMMCYGYEMTIPSTKQEIPFKSFETGKLKYGNGNPSSEEYRSLADFCYKDGCLEIRIPWQLLNVMDPSSKQMMDDFYSVQSISPKSFDSFSVGAGLLKAGATGIEIKLDGSFTYTGWKFPTYHERLKPSYYVLQEALKLLV